MRLFLIAAAAAFVTACTPAAEEADVMSEGCDARAASQWTARVTSFSIEASTEGPDCERAVVTLVIRASSGVPVLAEAHLSRDVMLLAPARDPAAMQTALAEWVDTSRPVYASTGQLPPWPANAEYPVSGDFTFYVSEGIDRETYDALRRRDVPAFCYVQTIERLNCLAFDNISGALISVGVKTFSG